MVAEEENVRLAVRRFYDAIERMIRGDGLAAMRDAWHQSDRVTTGHPSGEWAQGWDEVWATWQVFAAFGRPESAGSTITDLRVFVYGDVAYAICTFVGPPSFGAEKLACTDILHRVDGVWKMVHHHADKSPNLTGRLEQRALGG